MPTLISLPNEIVHNIFTFVQPSALGKLSSTCKTVHRFISNDKHLWKDVYCMNLDTPVFSNVTEEFDFQEELPRFVRSANILNSRLTVEEKIPELPLIADVVVRLSKFSIAKDSRNLLYLETVFGDHRERKDNFEAFLCQSVTFARSKIPNDMAIAPPLAIRQLSAKLHVLKGQYVKSPRRAGYSYSYPFAASMVYDLRNYRDDTFWGPYLPDGKATVDWEKMEVIMIVLGHNMRMFPDLKNDLLRPHWNEPFWGTSPNSFVQETSSLPPISLSSEPPLDFEDPYNITGTWMRIVTFLDFHELFSYNFIRGAPPPGEPREPIHTSEAVRMIAMVLKATKREDPGPEDGQGLPIIYFEGTARAIDNSDPNSDSRIQGTVRLTKEGEVRWESYSFYGTTEGEPRWKSDGIQVGGPNSGRGVLGHWFDKDFSQHGPAGPTAYWKISDVLDDVEQFTGQHMRPTWDLTFNHSDDDEGSQPETPDGEVDEGDDGDATTDMYGPALAAALLGVEITVVNDVGETIFNGPGELLQTFLDAAGIGASEAGAMLAGAVEEGEGSGSGSGDGGAQGGTGSEE